MKTAENGKAHVKLWFKELFVCNHCGNLIAFVKNSGVPAYSVKDGIVHVDVGSILHPMNEDHHIEWISLQTKYGNQRKELCLTGEPSISFAICEGDEVEAVYAYCNLHGLWVTDSDLS